MGRIVRNKYIGLSLAVLLIALMPSSLDLPLDKQMETKSAFNPVMVRGFNTSAFGDLKRAKEVYGANVFRLQLTPRTEANGSKITVAAAWENQLNRLESALKEAAREGVYVIIDMHEPPVPDLRLQITSAAFWSDDNNLQILIDSWKEIVQRFKPYRENIWGYDLLNEPYNADELPLGADKWQEWAQKITDAIRYYDIDTPIIYEASPGALPRGFVENRTWQRTGTFQLLDDDKVIYSFHMYNPFAYTHQGLSVFNKAPVTEDWPGKAAYPGIIEGTRWDKKMLIHDLQPIIDFQNKYRVPIYVGEFSAIRWAPGAAEYIRDLIEIFESRGWSWTYHAYREWHGWDVEYDSEMTSDANREAAKAADPTDRALVLKTYFGRNQFLPPKD